MVATWVVLCVAAVVVVTVVAWGATRNRILSVMAWRNALRRPRQTVMVVAGLMVGTAIVAAALTASDSLDSSVREATYTSFGEIDETVYLEGFGFFPEFVADELAADAALAGVAEAVAPQAIWAGSAVNEATGLYEPRVRIIGFDPPRDRPFGPFLDGDQEFWGDDLARDEVILVDSLAQALGARVGDTLRLNFSRPLDPVVPDVDPFQGRVTGVAGLPIAGGVQPGAQEQSFDVGPNALAVLAVVAWQDPQQDLDVVIQGPDDREYANREGTIGEPDSPATVGANGTIAAPLSSGSWTVRVEGKGAADVPFSGVFVALYAEYNLAVLQEAAERFDNASLPFPMEDLARPERASATLTVRHITDGGKGRQFLDANTMFIRLDALQGLLDRSGQINLVKVTNPGDGRAGPDTAHVVFPELEAALARVQEAHPDSAPVQALKADNDKVYWLAVADQSGELFTLFLGFISSFSVIAGLLLILNIFTMLAEERKAELAISRAVGLTRRDLVRLFVFEGALYAVVAAAIGTFVGLALSYAMIWGFNAFLAGTFMLPPVPFRVRASSLVLAFSLGVLLTFATIWVAAHRSSRLNIVRAIRRLEEPEILRGGSVLVTASVLVGVGLAIAAAGLLAGSFAGQVAGPILAAVGAGLLLRRRFTRRLAYPSVALILFAYFTVTLFLIQDYDREAGEIFGPVRAIAMAACIVVVVLYNEKGTRLAAWILARVKPLRPVALPATAYPLHKKFRTGMTLLMFAVILLMVSLFSIFGNLFLQDPERETGGYHVRGETTQAIVSLDGHGDASALDGVVRYDVLPFFFKLGGDLVLVSGEMTGQFGPPRDTIWGIDPAFAQSNEFRLIFRSPEYPDDVSAYRAVASRDDVVIVSYHYSTDEQGADFGHDVGETLQIRARGTTKDLTIIGVQEQIHFKGAFVRQSLVGQLFTNTDTMLLFELEDPDRAAEVARTLEVSYRDIGLDAADLRAQVVVEQQQFRQLLSMVQVFLGLGLVVGILSLGIVTARNVVERRQEIGMLRALGFTRAHVRRTFLVETLATVTLGVLIGGFVAVLISYGLWVALLRDLGIDFGIPWIELALIAMVAYVATTLATLSPIFRAARIPPAEALRYIE